MTSERADQPAAPERPAGGPGKTLAAQREAMGWSVEQVADQLKLAVRQVVALEADDFAALPSPAVTRGFVRAYAKILKLDAAPLVAQVPVDSAPPVEVNTVRREARPATFSESRFPSHGRRSGLPLGWIGAAVVVFAAAGAAWKFGLIPLGQQHAEPAASSDTAVLAPAASAPAANGSASDTLHSTSVPLISVPAPAAEGAAAPGGETAAPAAGTATPPAAAATPPAAAATAPAAPAATAPAAQQPAANAAPAPEAAPAAGGNALVFTVSEDSWIDVRPAKGGKPLVSRLVKAGSTETFNVTEPVKVVVGNTHGVRATLRGNAVELPGKTARVNLQ
jgi:cytoskeleton protein RodZ